MTVVHYFRHSTCFSSLYFQLTLHFKFPWLYENSNLVAMSEELRISFYLKMKFCKRFIRLEIPHSFIFNTYTIVELLNKTALLLLSWIFATMWLQGQKKLRANLESAQKQQGSWQVNQKQRLTFATIQTSSEQLQITLQGILFDRLFKINALVLGIE